MTKREIQDHVTDSVTAAMDVATAKFDGIIDSMEQLTTAVGHVSDRRQADLDHLKGFIKGRHRMKVLCYYCLLLSYFCLLETTDAALVKAVQQVTDVVQHALSAKLQPSQESEVVETASATTTTAPPGTLEVPTEAAPAAGAKDSVVNRAPIHRREEHLSQQHEGVEEDAESLVNSATAAAAEQVGNRTEEVGNRTEEGSGGGMKLQALVSRNVSLQQPSPPLQQPPSQVRQMLAN